MNQCHPVICVHPHDHIFWLMFRVVEHGRLRITSKCNEASNDAQPMRQICQAKRESVAKRRDPSFDIYIPLTFRSNKNDSSS